MKLLHVITGLDRGGAEFFLYRLLSRLDRSRFTPRVVSLQPPGDVAEKIRTLDIPVSSPGMSPSRPNPSALFDLNRTINQFQPDLIQTWMYHADLLGGLVGRFYGQCPILWSLRQSTVKPGTTRFRTLFIIHLCSILSRRIPDRIVVNSKAGREAHLQLGYPRNRTSVIPNGYDTETFQPSDQARKTIREELEVPVDTPLIGLVARYHPQKDHQTFLKAAGQLARTRSDVHFLLCGKNVNTANDELIKFVRKNNVSERVHLLGKRDDIPRIQASLDIATSSSSFAEGNPNVIGEAMACGVPCVVTDIGDSGWLVGDTGKVVPSKSPDKLAKAWEELLKLSPDERKQLGKQARDRIKNQFSLDKIKQRYEKLYEQLISNHRRI